MSRMDLAGLALIGLAACTSPSPRQQSGPPQGSRKSVAAAPSPGKPVVRAVPARSTTTTTKQSLRRAATTHADTATHAVNPLTNH